MASVDCCLNRVDYPTDNLDPRRDIGGAKRVDVNDGEGEFDGRSAKEDARVGMNADVPGDDEAGDGRDGAGVTDKRSITWRCIWTRCGRCEWR